MYKVWGYHLLLDVARCKPSLIRCPYNITAFSDSLVKRIDMIPYGKPQVIHFGKEDKAGYTLVQLIETSNITAHFSESENAFWLDCFSCKPYDISTVEETVREYFSPELIHKRFIKREVPESKYLK